MRKTMMSLLLILLLAAVGVAQAQSLAPVACGNLSEADCAILEQSQAALADVSSFGVSISANLDLVNIPDAPNPLTFVLAGNGAVNGDMSTFHMSTDEMQTMMADPQAYADTVSQIFNHVDMSASLLLTLPEALVEETGGQIPGTLPLEVRLVDGVGYVNTGALATALGEQGVGLPPGWFGIDVAELMSQMMSMGDMMGSTAAMDPALMSRFGDPAFLNEFMTIERLDDTTAADGTAVASFHTVIDYQALFNDPTMLELFTASLDAQGVELSDDERQEMLSMMSQMFRGFSADVFQTIGLEDFYPRNMQMNFSWDMKSFMDLLASQSEAIPEGPAPAVHFSFVVNYADFNNVPDIAAPEDATVLPLDALMGGMPGGADGQWSAAPVETQPTPTPEG